MSAAPGWRERMAAVRHIPAFLRLIWETHRGYTCAVVVLRALRALVPLASLWAGKLIVDAVVAAARGEARDPGALWRYVAIEATILMAGDLLARASTLMESLLGDRFANHVSVRLIEHAATLDLEQFEDPTFYDHLERARIHTTDRLGLLAELLAIGQDLLTLATLAAALLAYSPLLGLLLVVAVLPSFLGETHFAGMEYSLLFRHTPQRRELGYLRFVGASTDTAKELQLFGFSPWIVDRYRTLARRFEDDNRRLMVRKAVVSSLLAVVGMAGYYGAYVRILADAVAGTVSVGELTMLATAFWRSRELIGRLLTTASGIHRQSLVLRDLFVFLALRPRIATRPGARLLPATIREGFAFENVGFRYPGREEWAIRNVSFRLRPGERLALVGENGAGKTTLTKLLARLYDPTEGRVTLDGVDLRDYDLASLRGGIGVIFQDFVRYNMRFDENVGVGKIAPVRGYVDGDGGELPAPIRDAAERSLAATLLPRLPAGYRQMLGKHFSGGVDLSGGEWQKVALARAYMCDGRLVILDEPTAALDARAEFEVFDRFAGLMRGRMTVLISHRFSTVRMADRILVLAHGKLVEEGSHEELLARDGLYAELFGMQAAGYR
ncbi:MAG TPA: ABC transporter ATP-binding protein [Longimicrobium sp.]|nr:ABC transporter ATP-binding protein [Longimicrobium sp.]